MGGNQTAIFQQGQPLTNYEVVQKVPQHNISYLKHKTTNKEYMIREFAINDKTQFAQTCEKVKNRKKMESQYLTKLQRFSQQLQDNLCSAFYKIFAMWEYPTHTLADQINERALHKRRFQQNQIFSIIASIIEGMSCLQSSGVKHQCLTTSSILFDETGTVKVADPLTSIAPSNFDRINTNRKAKGVYISPQQCQSLKNQRPIPNRNPYKSDVFILGVIMLQCGLLQSMDGVFVESFQDMDFQELNQKLDNFGKIYSKDLKLTVSTMLTRDPKERMDWIGLKQYVPQKNDVDANKQTITTGSSFGYKTQNIPQVISQQPVKLTLGGNSKIETSLNTYSRQPVTTFAKYQPQTHYNYGSITTQPNAAFNQTFGQSFSYQPTNNFNQTNLPFSTSNNFAYTSMNSNIYSNPPKVSNYIIESKPSFQRPTEEFIASNNVSKLNSGLTGTMVDRESSSFPFNSQLEFKKDYLSGVSNYNKLSHGVENQAIPANYTAANNAGYSSLSPDYSLYSPLGYACGSVGQVINSVQKNQGKSQFKNNEKTQNNSRQGGNSPLLSNYVKDAKSITYDKNLYSSYITEEKSHVYMNQQQIGHQMQPVYSNAVSNSNNDEMNGNQFGNNYYLPINKPGNINTPQQNVPHYVPNPNPVLYQPLSTSSGVKQKPMINQPFSMAKTNSPQKEHFSIRNQPSQQQSHQNYQYKQIHSNNQPPHPSSQPINSASINQSAFQGSQQLQYVIEHFKQGSRYQGTKYQDMRHGQGKFFYQDGGMYEGNWKFNKMDGFGKLYYQSGKIAYEGNWTKDQFQGFGKLYNEQPDELHQPFDYENFDMIDEYWMFYQGNFMGDQKDGEGKMVFSNGQFFIGSFQKDMVDGPGEFHMMNGEVVRGTWNQNQLVEVEE